MCNTPLLYCPFSIFLTLKVLHNMQTAGMSDHWAKHAYACRGCIRFSLKQPLHACACFTQWFRCPQFIKQFVNLHSLLSSSHTTQSDPLIMLSRHC